MLTEKQLDVFARISSAYPDYLEYLLSESDKAGKQLVHEDSEIQVRWLQGRKRFLDAHIEILQRAKDELTRIANTRNSSLKGNI